MELPANRPADGSVPELWHFGQTRIRNAWHLTHQSSQVKLRTIFVDGVCKSSCAFSANEFNHACACIKGPLRRALVKNNYDENFAISDWYETPDNMIKLISILDELNMRGLKGQVQEALDQFNGKGFIMVGDTAKTKEVYTMDDVLSYCRSSVEHFIRSISSQAETNDTIRQCLNYIIGLTRDGLTDIDRVKLVVDEICKITGVYITLLLSDRNNCKSIEIPKIHRNPINWDKGII